jgi:hypothetical protein
MKLKIFNLILLLYVIKQSIGQEKSFDICKRPIPNFLSCIGFEKFTDLNFTQTTLGPTFDFIEISPKALTSFDKRVNLKGIFGSAQTQVDLSNIDSFLINSNPFNDIIIRNENMNELTLKESNFLFKIDDDNLLSKKCGLDLIDFDEIDSILKSFNNLILTETLKYEEATCPFIFKNARLSTLSLYNLTYPLNSLVFVEVGSIAGERLNSNINRVEVHKSRLDKLDTGLLNQYVFKKMESLIIIDSNLNEISEKLFDNFDEIKSIQLKLNTFENFFRPGNVNWTVYLNRSASISRDRQILVSFIDASRTLSYKYPDEDLCLFKFWPHQHNVFAYIQHTNEQYECTCTLIWLLHKWKNYALFSLNNTSVSKCLNDQFFDEKFNECNFQVRFKLFKRLTLKNV